MRTQEQENYRAVDLGVLLILLEEKLAMGPMEMLTTHGLQTHALLRL